MESLIKKQDKIIQPKNIFLPFIFKCLEQYPLLWDSFWHPCPKRHNSLHCFPLNFLLIPFWFVTISPFLYLCGVAAWLRGVVGCDRVTLLEELARLCMLLRLLLPDSLASASAGNISLRSSSSLSPNSSYWRPLDSGVPTETGVLCCGRGETVDVLKYSDCGVVCTSWAGSRSRFSSSSHQGGRKRRRSALFTYRYIDETNDVYGQKNVV